jgi:hypothetical protein|tara:strand:+ start:250 stop:426 length:177 start_codon:yes stop_codon:yes gene_type:complete
MNVVWILIWMQFVPDQGIYYHHLGTFNNKTLCGGALGKARVLVNDPSETLQCIELELE